MRRFLVAFLLCTTSAAVGAAEAPPKIGLVLGGGGARGGAHIGVLRVMEELNIPVDYVAGTSIGSLVGALYSAGYSPDEIQLIVERIPWEQAFRDAPDRRHQSFRRRQEDLLALVPYEVGLGKEGISGKKGVLQGTRIDFVFRSLTLEANGLESFDELHIPYRAVAADLKNGEMVVLDRGDLARAMRASMSLPGIFAPVEIDGRVLVDGGIARNIPVDVARSMGADEIIAVDVGTPLRESVEDLSPAGVLSQTATVMAEANRVVSRAEIGSKDLLMTPELGDFSANDFEHIVDTIAIGEAIARAHETELRRYSVDEATWAAFLKRQRRASAGALPTVQVDAIRLEGFGRIPPERILKRLETKAGVPLDLKALYRDMDRLWEFGEFQSVGYRVESGAQGNTLVLEGEPKSWGPNYLRIGLSLDTDFKGVSRFHLTGQLRRPNVNRAGAEWRTFVVVGNPFQAFTEFYQPIRGASPWFVVPSVYWNRERAEAFLPDETLEEITTRGTGGTLDVGYRIGNFGEIRVGALKGRIHVSPDTTTTFPTSSHEVGGPRAQATLDRLDDVYLPTMGNRSTLTAFLARESFGSDDTYDAVELSVTQAGSFGRNTLVGKLKVGTSLGSTIPFYSQFRLGGLFNLAGYPPDSLRGDEKMLLSLTSYRLFKDLGTLGTLFAGVALETGNVFAAADSPSFSDLQYSGTLFAALSTGKYPIYLGYGLAEGGREAAYLVVGRVF
jgi:NTE family protein